MPSVTAGELVSDGSSVASETTLSMRPSSSRAQIVSLSGDGDADVAGLARAPAHVLAAAADLRQQRGVGVQLAAGHRELGAQLAVAVAAAGRGPAGGLLLRSAVPHEGHVPSLTAYVRKPQAGTRQVGHPARTSLGRRPVAVTHSLDIVYDVEVRAQRSTSLANSRSSSSRGSLVRPVWTGPACTIVLAGATSQWKRSEAGSCGDRAALRLAVGDVLDRLQQRLDLGRVAPGRERGQQRLVEVGAGAEEAQRAAEEHDAGVDRLAALDARDDPQRRVLERATPFGHARPPAPTRAAPRAAGPGTRRRGRRRPTRAGPARPRPPGRPGRRAARRRRRSTPRRAAGRGRGSPGRRLRARGSGSGAWNAYRAAPWSIRYRFECQRSRFGLRGVRSTLVTSESSQTTSAASSASGGCVRVVGQRAGQEVDAEVDPRAGRDQLLDLGVGLGVAERGVELDQHQLGHRQAQVAGELAGHDLGRQRLRALARAAELEHVEAVVVGLHDARQGASLAQRRHVARGGHRAQHEWHDG